MMSGVFTPHLADPRAEAAHAAGAGVHRPA